MDEQLKEKIIALYKQGLSIQKIADLIGSTPPTVWKVIPKNVMRGVHDRGRAEMNKVLVGKVRDLYEQGMSLRSIGETIGVSHETIRKMIPEDEKRWKRLTKEEIREILKTFRETGSYQKAADALSIDRRQLVYYVVAKYAKKKEPGHASTIRRSRV